MSFMDIITSIVFLFENIMIYFLLLFGARYIFLEKLPDKNKYKTFYIVTFSIVSVTSIFIDVVSQLLAIFFCGLAIAIGREKKKKIRGFFVTFPVIGIINGLVVPMLILPVVLFEITDVAVLIYHFALHALMYLIVLFFWIKGKKWREQFEIEAANRQLHKWEFLLLGIVSIFMTLYSFGLQKLPAIDNYTANVFIYIKICLTALTIMSFILTIMVIILVLQGNKRSYYHKEAQKRRESVERLSMQMVNTLANTIDAKDSYTNGHSTRVAKYSVMIAKKMGYDDKHLELVEYTALLHDIGKIGIPREIINKPSRLTDEEYDIIKTHPGIGSKILEEITEIPDIAIGAKYHHERFDGRGYPDKLAGYDIPEIARIIGVADAYDAMTSKRSYRDVLSQNIVRDEVEKCKGSQFDPEIADIMLTIIDEDKHYKLHE